MPPKKSLKHKKIINSNNDDDDDDDDDEEDKTKKYWLEQAKNGNVDAMYTLGSFLDGPRGKKWLEKAAGLGHRAAKIYLGKKRAAAKRVASAAASAATWGEDEEILFTKDIIGDFGASVHNSHIIHPDNIFFKQELMETKKSKKKELDFILQHLPCQEYLGYMQRSIGKMKLDYAYIMSNSSSRSKSKISAIIFAQKGECHEYPDIWTVRLICATPGTKDARTLLGLYCFALKTIRQPIGLLEVAKSYNNLQAYCLYAKFRFEEAYNYEGWQGCAKFTHMPLVVNLHYLQIKDIIQIVSGERYFKNKLCDKPIVAEAQTARVKGILLPKWAEIGLNTRKFFKNP